MSSDQKRIASQPGSVASASAYWAGWLSLALAVAGMVLIFLGDPLWLGLPSSAAAVLAGRFALRRGQDHHAAPHLGLALGLFNLFVWLLLIVLIHSVLDIDLSSLFEIPTPDPQ